MLSEVVTCNCETHGGHAESDPRPSEEGGQILARAVTARAVTMGHAYSTSTCGWTVSVSWSGALGSSSGGTATTTAAIEVCVEEAS